MFKFAVLAILALGCNAQSYGGFQGTKGQQREVFQQRFEQAPMVQAPMVQTYQTKAAPIAYSAPQTYGPIEAAVQSRRTVEVREMTIPQDYIQPQIIEVNADHMPVQIHFKSSSSPVTVRQSHTPGTAGPVEHTSYQDQAHRLVNEVIKPVIQEVREIIQPYRRVTQEIRPVIEEVHTVIHKGERPIVQQQLPLPLAVKAPASYGSGAALAGVKAQAEYRAAKAAKA